MEKKHYSIVLFGAHRVGNILINNLKDVHREFLVVDHNPEIIDCLVNKKIHCLYGDASNVEILHRLNLKKTKAIISTIPNDEDNNFLIKYVKKVNPKIKVFVIANQINKAIDFYEMGADYVIVPHILGGYKFASLFKAVIDNPKKMVNIRTKHIKDLLNAELFNL